MKLISTYIGGIIFGLGLAISGAAIPEVTLSFLRFEDFGLLFVLGIGLLITLYTYQIIPRVFKRPFFGGEFSVKPEATVDRRVIVGAVLFGIGWGISGLCPATSLAAIGMGNTPVLFGVLGMFLGALFYGSWRSGKER